MVTTVNSVDGVFSLEINFVNMPFRLKLDMSGKRHWYPAMEATQAKPMNSILHFDVTQEQIEQDLYHLGGQLEARIGQTGLVAPSWQSQLVSAGRALIAQGGGINVRAAIEAARQNDPTILFGDYQSMSGRTYRVDNVAMDRLKAPNHCYPIAGPGLWSNVSQAQFAAAVALRRLQLVMARKRQSLTKVWLSLQHDNTTSEVKSAITGARTHLSAFNQQDLERLGEASGQLQLILEARKLA